jgi:predicted phage terminase large subunit-like protein
MKNLQISSLPFDPSLLPEIISRIETELASRQETQAQQENLIDFLRGGWRYVDPAPYVHGWHLEAIAEHLEGVTRGQIKRLIINIPPRTSKSSCTSIAWPAWTWAQSQLSPSSGPHVQFLFSSYAQSISVRDSVKTRRLIESPWYQKRWGDRFKLTGDQNTKIRFENDKGGYRLATSVDGSLTGEGAQIIVVDDPHNATEMESEVTIESTLMWWDEAMGTRLNDMKTGAYVVIMQRLRENDLTGHILSKEHDWCHLMLPMEYEPARHCVTSIGWSDPRTKDGELLCPERFGKPEVRALKARLGPFGAAGQLQQSPKIRGGNIFKRDWWQLWESPDGKFPALKFVLASLDPAYTEKQENDPSGLTIWGVFEDKHRNGKVILMNAWRKRLELHGPEIPRLPGESEQAYIRRASPDWGLIEWVAHSCRRFKIDLLLIEAKASGLTVAQEIRRLYANDAWGIRLIDPKTQDKVARAYSVQHLFADGIVYAPDREWAEMVIEECEVFPKGTHDDLVDSTTQALRYLRDVGLAIRREERAAQEQAAMMHRSEERALYPV